MATKPGPKKKNAVCGNGGATLVYFKGQRRRLLDVATDHGLEGHILYGRWRRAGMPREIEEKMLFPKCQQPVQHKVTLMPDNVEMTVFKLAEMFGLHDSTIYYRVKKGKTVFTREDIAAINRKKRVLTGNTTEKYSDPDYLPDIPHGDLAHLSGRTNKGRGKGEIPDEEWINRIVTKPRNNTLNCLESIFTGGNSYQPY